MASMAAASVATLRQSCNRNRNVRRKRRGRPRWSREAAEIKSCANAQKATAKEERRDVASVGARMAIFLPCHGAAADLSVEAA